MKTKSKPKFITFQIIKWNGQEWVVYDIYTTVDRIVWYYIATHPTNSAAQWVKETDLVAA